MVVYGAEDHLVFVSKGYMVFMILEVLWKTLFCFPFTCAVMSR